jgi:hypothetical protein
MVIMNTTASYLDYMGKFSSNVGTTQVSHVSVSFILSRPVWYLEIFDYFEFNIDTCWIDIVYICMYN